MLIKKAGARVLGKEIIRKEMKEPRFKIIWRLNPGTQSTLRRKTLNIEKLNVLNLGSTI